MWKLTYNFSKAINVKNNYQVLRYPSIKSAHQGKGYLCQSNLWQCLWNKRNIVSRITCSRGALSSRLYNKETTSILPFKIVHTLVVIYQPLPELIFHNSYVTLQLAVCIQTFHNVTNIWGIKQLSWVSLRLVSTFKGFVGNIKTLLRCITCVQMTKDGIGN